MKTLPFVYEDMLKQRYTLTDLTGGSLDYTVIDHLIKILSIDVPENKRRQGVGRSLLRRLISLAKENQMDVILDPDSSEPESFKNKDLIKFYESEGFQKQPDNSMIYKIK